MKQLLLALGLIIAPVAAFSGYEIYFNPEFGANTQSADIAASLGDLTTLKTIAADTREKFAAGDMTGAEKRISDFETAWDEAQPAMQPQNPEAWGVVDAAADAAIHALRAKTIDSAKTAEALGSLIATLDNPLPAATASINRIEGIAVTDAGGHALPCEVMLKTLGEAIMSGQVPAEKSAAATDYQTSATERCNADDDMHANEFSARGLALAAK
jgi:hypothetical protein